MMRVKVRLAQFSAGLAEAVIRTEYDPVDVVTEVINRAEHALAQAMAQGPGKLWRWASGAGGRRRGVECFHHGGTDATENDQGLEFSWQFLPDFRRVLRGFFRPSRAVFAPS